MTTLRLRPLTGDELAGYYTLVANAFLGDPDPDPAASRVTIAVLESARFLGIFDADRLIGGGGILTRDITLPGAGPSPVAAVTYVGVRPDARGRGALTALMRTQLDGLRDGGEPIAALWASQAPIYGRFGYGRASRRATLTVSTPAPFRSGADGAGEVRWFDEAGSAATVRAIHRRLVPSRVGWLSRPEVSWRWWLADADRGRHGNTAYRFAVHHPADGGAPDGYAVFRIKPDWPAAGPNYEIHVHELAAANPTAHARLWRELLDLDMVRKVSYSNVPLDDPIPFLLVNPRAAVTDVSDALWLRLVELERALAARRYAAECDVVLDVTDRFCPWNAGRWRLRVDADGVGEVARSQDDADLACDVTDLAEAYLGATRLTALAAAGRVRELRPGALRAASRAMVWDVEPYCLEVF